MKKIAKILMMLAFLFCAVSCNSIDKSEFDISQEIKGSDQRENIARVIASMNIDNSEVSKIHAGVLKALDEGLHETYFMKELMCEDSKIVKGENQTSVFIEYTEKLEKNDDSLNQLLDYYNEGNNANILQIYWPFSENWDGKTKPVISFLPEDKTQATNKAYYMENGELKSLKIDRNYAMLHPVWIINESSLGYDKIPDFNEKRKGDFLNIAPRNVIVDENDKISPKLNLPNWKILDFEEIRALRDGTEMFFCESITYTFSFSIPVVYTGFLDTYEIVVTMTESELNSQEFKQINLENVGAYSIYFDPNYNIEMYVAINRIVSPKNIIRPFPLMVNEGGVPTTIVYNIQSTDEDDIYYETTIDLTQFNHSDQVEVFQFGELECKFRYHYYVGI